MLPARPLGEGESGGSCFLPAPLRASTFLLAKFKLLVEGAKLGSQGEGEGIPLVAPGHRAPKGRGRWCCRAMGLTPQPTAHSTARTPSGSGDGVWGLKVQTVLEFSRHPRPQTTAPPAPMERWPEPSTGFSPSPEHTVSCCEPWAGAGQLCRDGCTGPPPGATQHWSLAMLGHTSADGGAEPLGQASQGCGESAVAPCTLQYGARPSAPGPPGCPGRFWVGLGG